MLMLGWWTHFRCESDKDHMVVGWVYQYGNVEVEESFYHESQSGQAISAGPCRLVQNIDSWDRYIDLRKLHGAVVCLDSTCSRSGT